MNCWWKDLVVPGGKALTGKWLLLLLLLLLPAVGCRREAPASVPPEPLTVADNTEDVPDSAAAGEVAGDAATAAAERAAAEALATTPATDTPAPTAPSPTETPIPPMATATATPPSTLTPSPTRRPPTATSVPVCRPGAVFVADITIPDNALLEPGESFRKTWRLRNSGNCNWEPGYQLVFISGDALGSSAQPPTLRRVVAPGQQVDVSADLQAPWEPGDYRGRWQMQTERGLRFGETPWVQIVVQAPTPLPVPTTPVPQTLNWRLQPGAVRTLAAGFLPNPTDVYLAGGGDIDVRAAGLGADCLGYANAAPDFRLHWSGESSELGFFFEEQSDRDTTLIVSAPDESWFCNDDYNYSLDPGLILSNPAEGQYDIWIGAFDADEWVSGTLSITAVP